jgi:hypothetical protein
MAFASDSMYGANGQCDHECGRKHNKEYEAASPTNVHALDGCIRVGPGPTTNFKNRAKSKQQEDKHRPGYCDGSKPFGPAQTHRRLTAELSGARAAV